MKIGIDAMGGDHAPEPNVIGAILAYKELSKENKIVLFGDENKIVAICKNQQFDPSNFEIVHTEEVIEMGDNPVKAFSQKIKSSINLGFEYLGKDKIDGFASAGSTGAMLIGSMYTVKSIEGIIRPVITASIPQENGNYKILLDVGINPDCKPEILCQWAILGSIYAENIYNIKNPKVGLLNIGSEEEKGNLLIKSTYPLLKEMKQINFFGNIEGNDIFDESKADVIVCDGFVGNVVLKEAEAFYSLLKRRKINDPFIEKFNFENYGGTPILGINKTVIIAHGHSNSTAIKNTILLTKDVIETKICEKIKLALN